MTPVANAKCDEARYATAPAGDAQGAWQSGGLFPNSRAMPVNRLTPGTNDAFQVRAIGGSTGYADWSGLNRRPEPLKPNAVAAVSNRR